MRLLGIALIVIIVSVNAFNFYQYVHIDFIAVFSQFLGATALLLMVISQFIATRFRIVEILFGSLDQSYKLHKWLGIGATISFLLHDMIDADIKGQSRNAFYSFAESLGEISMIGLLVLIVISIIVFLPYNLWKWTHRFMGFFFSLAMFHYILISKPFENFSIAGIYIATFCLMGILFYIYTLLPETFKQFRAYKVSNVNFQNNVSIISLLPVNRGIKYKAGQFAFLKFQDELKEVHPYTISSMPEKTRVLRFSIKTLGDYTSKLYGAIQVGDTAYVQGAFGHFVRKPSKKAEIWIAGGIGITPFVAWCQSINDKNKSEIHLFYCVRDRDTSPHIEELEQQNDSVKNFNLHIIESNKGGHLSISAIEKITGLKLNKVKVYFCGPLAMRKVFLQGFLDLGLKRKDFHYEEFDFKSGIGFRKIMAFLKKNKKT